MFICAFVAFFLFLSVNRAGGEIGFDAVVLSVDGDMIRARVTRDSASLFSKHLPDEIVFDAKDSGVFDLEAGDKIRGTYLRGTIDGDFVEVVEAAILDEDSGTLS